MKAAVLFDFTRKGKYFKSRIAREKRDSPSVLNIMGLTGLSNPCYPQSCSITGFFFAAIHQDQTN